MFETTAVTIASIGAGAVIVGAVITGLMNLLGDRRRSRSESRARLFDARSLAFANFLATAEIAYNIMRQLGDLKGRYRIWRSHEINTQMKVTRLPSRVLRMQDDLPRRLAELRLVGGDAVVDRAEDVLDVLASAADEFDQVELRHFGGAIHDVDWEAKLEDLKVVRAAFIAAARSELLG